MNSTATIICPVCDTEHKKKWPSKIFCVCGSVARYWPIAWNPSMTRPENWEWFYLAPRKICLLGDNK